MKNRPRPRQLFVRSLSARSTTGILQFGWISVPCALGRSGRGILKREGDGLSPVGAWRILELRYRSDRLRRPRTPIRLIAARPNDGWCDAPSDRNYNRPVAHPYTASAERMWRQDGLYDIVAVLDYNICPRRRGAGSAIFLHVARLEYSATEGCIALSLPDLQRLLAMIGRAGAVIRI